MTIFHVVSVREGLMEGWRGETEVGSVHNTVFIQSVQHILTRCSTEIQFYKSASFIALVFGGSSLMWPLLTCLVWQLCVSSEGKSLNTTTSVICRVQPGRRHEEHLQITPPLSFQQLFLSCGFSRTGVHQEFGLTQESVGAAVPAQLQPGFIQHHHSLPLHTDRKWQSPLNLRHQLNFTKRKQIGFLNSPRPSESENRDLACPQVKLEINNIYIFRGSGARRRFNLTLFNNFIELNWTFL